MPSSAYIKQRTIELYDSLPMVKDERIKCIAVRDEIIDLNYKFFGYVASSTYADNAQYEDKLQTALMAFLGMWWKYKFAPEYRTDLSFSVFFKPRLSEEIRRYLCSVSNTTRRTVCMKAAKQLGKHWAEITFDDISKVNLPPNDMIALKAVLGANIPADIADFDMYLQSTEPVHTIESYQTTKYYSIEELLIQEMIEKESQLTDKDLSNMADMYGLKYLELKAKYPKALETLYQRLTENSDL